MEVPRGLVLLLIRLLLQLLKAVGGGGGAELSGGQDGLFEAQHVDLIGREKPAFFECCEHLAPCFVVVLIGRLQL